MKILKRHPFLKPATDFAIDSPLAHSIVSFPAHSTAYLRNFILYIFTEYGI